MNKNLVAIGDVHGCAKSLQKLLHTLEPYSGSTFVFIGDYIDRGPDSKSVFDIVIEFGKKEECVFLRGNHEAMMLDALENGDDFMWKLNGGRQTLESLKMSWPDDFIDSPYYDFLRDTKYYYETEDFFFTHGGLHPLKSIEESLSEDSPENLLWERSHIDMPRPVWNKPVVFGHTPMSKPMDEPLKIGIDTGCVFAKRPGLGMLTAVILPERKFIQQPYID
ncbi:MAG: serine/threonine protein phosphatase [Balneolia bacterium]|nr:serine/threonine protein phosphatase [Balneolia bacterium]